MNLYVEEIIVLFFIIVSVPALVYGLEKVSKKRLFNKKLIIILYVVIFYIFFMNIEKLRRDIDDGYDLIIPDIFGKEKIKN